MFCLLKAQIAQASKQHTIFSKQLYTQMVVGSKNGSVQEINKQIACQAQNQIVP